jgi:1-deoxy-D-xylulose 5-phosphate reductoisomerase
VEAFLNNGIAYQEIPRIIESVLGSHSPQSAEDLETILKADAWARGEAAAIATAETSTRR